MKKCNKCGEVKPLEAFHKKAASKDGRQGRCKSCMVAYHSVYSAENRDRAAERGKKRDAKRIEELSDQYIRKLLVQNTELRFTDIPDWLVEAKREQLRLKRELRK